MNLNSKCNLTINGIWTWIVNWTEITIIEMVCQDTIIRRPIVMFDNIKLWRPKGHLYRTTDKTDTVEFWFQTRNAPSPSTSKTGGYTLNIKLALRIKLKHVEL